MQNALDIPTTTARARAFSRQDRWQYFAVASLATLTLGLARWLHPSPAGHGTHQQLGLPACTFLQLTGYPCPSCGLTTCFAHAAHFEFWAALVTQPFGLIAFVLTVLTIPGALYLQARRVTWETLLAHRLTTYALRALLVLYLLAWAYKIIVMRQSP